MSKFSKFINALSVILVICMVSAIAVSAATDTDVITYIKEIVEKHVYFVDDVEVTADEFNAVVNGNHIETIEKTVEHRISTETTYKINNEIVSAKEYEDYLEKNPSDVIIDTNPVSEPTEYGDYDTIVITQDSLTPMNCGSLGDYLTFTTDPWGKVLSAVVKSDKVVSAKYTYNNTSYLTYSTQGNDTNYYYFSTSYGVVYQDTTKGMYFKYGQPETTGFFVCKADFTTTTEISNGDTLFEIEYNDSIETIDFGFIFDSITLYIGK